jgi:hypothetical protein
LRIGCLKKIFGPKRDEVTGVEETTERIVECFILFTTYCSGNQIEKNEMGGACSTYGGGENCVLGFGGETRGKETIWKIQP